MEDRTIQIIVHYRQLELEKQVADVHAQAVSDRLYQTAQLPLQAKAEPVG